MKGAGRCSRLARATLAGVRATRVGPGALLLTVVLGAGACASPVGVQPWTLKQAFRQGYANALWTDSPTAFSDQLLLRLDLHDRFEKDPTGVLAALHAGLDPDGDEDRLFALAELSALHAGRTGERAHFLAAAVYAWTFLGRDGALSAATLVDPRQRLAMDIYNTALAQGLTVPRPPEATGAENVVELRGGSRPLPFGTLELDAPRTISWAGRPIERFVPAIQFAVHGLRNRYRDAGIGAPLIATLAPEEPGDSTTRPLAPVVSTTPMTVLLRIDDARRALRSGRVPATLEVHARDEQRTVEIKGLDVPLEFEPSATLAYTLKDASVFEGEILRFFGLRPRLLGQRSVVLRPMEPYRPGKIPVVLVHGTASSALRWAELFNELTSDWRIAARYQFWVFSYNTGDPIAFTGGLFRESLTRAVQNLDPHGTDAALRQMVVVGHSQGGLLAKLAVVDSGSHLWNTVSTTPLAELDVRPETREILRRSLFVTPLPFVSQVIFLATPHRGTVPGLGPLERAVSALIRFPGTVASAGADLLAALVRQDSSTRLREISPSPESMNPGSPFLNALAALPVDPNVTAHSIIAVKGSGPLTEASDGVVPYTSAHIEEAASEKVVQSGHSVQGHPAAIEEVRRILLEHAGIR